LDLRFSVGLSFDRSDADAIRALCASAGAGEVFLWPSCTLAKLGKLKLAGCSTVENKQLYMLGYLFELFYDLIISPSANVSRSPGFESCLGIFGGARVHMSEKGRMSPRLPWKGSFLCAK